MSKGTAAHGKHSGKSNMIYCRRCGQRTFHMRKKKCSSCGFGNSARLRNGSLDKQTK